MIETSIPDINVEELMEKIRAEVKQRKEKAKMPSGSISQNSHLPSSLEAKINLSEAFSSLDSDNFEIKDHYHINDFLKLRDRNFVMAAYRGILRRGPDSGGLDYFTENLRSGKMTKAEILGRLRYASEGRVKKTRVKGLFWNFLVQSSFGIPVLGYFSRLVSGIGNLPSILHNMQVFEEFTTTQLEFKRNDLAVVQTKMGEIIQALGVLDPVINSKIDRSELVDLKERVDATLEKKVDRSELADLKERVDATLDKKVDRSELADLKEGVDATLENKAGKDVIEDITGQIREILRQTRDHKLNILDQQRRLMFLLEEARKRLPEAISTEQIKAMLTEEDQMFNAMYVSFEDQFRGTREDIKKRQSVYLPYLEKAGFGNENLPILDVGCGRGEWLELLKEKGFKAQGVDLNSVLVEECLKRGLDVVRADVIRFLQGIPDQTLGVVTGFHIIEHLPLNVTVALLDEAMRVLKPGGMVTFETPNPQNLLVGACDFYQDPTHIRPLHPLSQKFLLEYRGFSRSEILYLNPPEDFDRLPEDEAPQLAGRLNNLLTCARDYAVLGYKV